MPRTLTFVNFSKTKWQAFKVIYFDEGLDFWCWAWTKKIQEQNQWKVEKNCSKNQYGLCSFVITQKSVKARKIIRFPKSKNSTVF